jgi:hypothetical protein
MGNESGSWQISGDNESAAARQWIGEVETRSVLECGSPAAFAGRARDGSEVLESATVGCGVLAKAAEGCRTPGRWRAGGDPLRRETL